MGIICSVEIYAQPSAKTAILYNYNPLYSACSLCQQNIFSKLKRSAENLSCVMRGEYSRTQTINQFVFKIIFYSGLALRINTESFASSLHFGALACKYLFEHKIKVVIFLG